MNKGTITQGFGQNKNAIFYQSCGHTGVDEVQGYGSPICALKYGHVYKILDNMRPANDGSGYWGIFIIAKEKDGSYSEWQIGHPSKILCKVGDKVEPWTVVGEEGNRGQVFSGGRVITKAEQDAGVKDGSHRHWNKKKLIRRSAFEHDRLPGPFLTQFGPVMAHYRDEEGYYYEIVDARNSCNGSVDPMKDLDEGYKVVSERFKAEIKVLQTSLEVASKAAQYPLLAGPVQGLINMVVAALKRWGIIKV